MSDNQKPTGGALVFACLLTVPLGVYQAFSDGFVLSKIWAWHAVPYGLPVISWKTFTAIAIAYALMRLRAPRAEPADARSEAMQSLATFIYLLSPWICLAIAWLLK